MFLPGEEWEGRYGFYATFYAKASDARAALHLVGEVLRDRMRAHPVSEVREGIFQTFYVVKKFGEVAAAAYSERGEKDLGFTFFRIGRFASIQLWLRYLFIRQFRRHLIVPLAFRAGRRIE